MKVLGAQNGVCAICCDPKGHEPGCGNRLYVDHDHLTGRVRGLLCHYCNTGIGNLKDDPEIILAALNYVLHHADSAR